MKKSGIHTFIVGAAVAAVTAVGTICHIDNPIIQTKYTADLAPDWWPLMQ